MYELADKVAVVTGAGRGIVAPAGVPSRQTEG